VSQGDLSKWCHPVRLDATVGRTLTDASRPRFGRRLRRDPVVRACAPFYAPFIYAEDRYAASYQAAEAIARHHLTSRELTKAAHRARVARLTEAATDGGAPADDVEWAGRILGGRNDKSMPQMIDELVAEADPLTNQLTARVTGFGSWATQARNSASHGGMRTEVTVQQRYWLGEILLWLVRLHLLRSAGISLDHLTQLITRRRTFDAAVDALVSETPGTVEVR
jgi:hypothetical protein